MLVRPDFFLLVDLREFLSALGSGVIKLFFCSTQLSMKFQLLIKLKMLKNKDLSCYVIFIMLINNCWHFNILIVGILTFMIMINFMGPGLFMTHLHCS